MLNNIQRQVLIGSLLGDGCLFINKQGKIPSLSITRTIKDKDYLLWQYEVFKNYINTTPLEYSTYDNRTNKTYYGIRFRTLTNNDFVHYFNEWYGTCKIVPNIEFTPLILAIWFADDGNVSAYKCTKRKSKCFGKVYHHVLHLKLATHCFSKKEVLYLRAKLNEYFNVNDFKMYKERAKSGKIQYTIRAFGSTAKLFFREIDSVFPPVMKRKSDIWRHSLANLYEDKKIISCKYCLSSGCYRNGKDRNGVQRYWCKKCRTGFA